MASTSTGALSGRELSPIDDRAARALSPKAKTIKSEKPFITLGWSVNSGVALARDLAIQCSDEAALCRPPRGSLGAQTLLKQRAHDLLHDHRRWIDLIDVTLAVIVAIVSIQLVLLAQIQW